MNDDQVRALVAQLDALVPRDDAYIAHGAGFYDIEHEPGYTGNRRGYLRFGIELLKVANAPSNRGQPDRVSVDLSYLADADVLQGQLLIFERREEIPVRSHAGERHNLRGIAVLALIALLAVAFFMGLRDILRGIP
jgi:hypothetical protein